MLDGLSPEAFRLLLARVRGPDASLSEILTGLVEKQLVEAHGRR